MSPINLLGLSPAALTAWLQEAGEKPFRARQLLRWLHRSGCDDFDCMSDLAKTFRAHLHAHACVQAPAVQSDSLSGDGTRKWLLDVGAGNGVEMVFIPENNRGTLCISTQAGCALDCSFCATGKQGFNRNLSAAEIVGQLWLANRLLAADEEAAIRLRAGSEYERPVSNVVFMGMGEPLANFEALVEALELMLSDDAYGLSRRRVTVSTSGIVPAIDQLREACPVALAVSLHAPDDALRDKLVPINRKYPLRELLAACGRYLARAPRDFITFEYVLLDAVNDRDCDAKKLLKLLADMPCKINLIPFNAFAGSPYRTAAPERVAAFARRLNDGGIVTTVRKTRGTDVAAACGQLAGQVRDRSRRTFRLQQEKVA